jgi:hypothetical protein
MYYLWREKLFSVVISLYIDAIFFLNWRGGGGLLGYKVIYYIPVGVGGGGVLGYKVIYYIPLARPPPQTTAIYRDFKKSTAICKVYKVGLRYIKKIISRSFLNSGTLIVITEGQALSRSYDFPPVSKFVWATHRKAE